MIDQNAFLQRNRRREILTAALILNGPLRRRRIIYVMKYVHTFQCVAHYLLHNLWQNITQKYNQNP